MNGRLELLDQGAECLPVSSLRTTHHDRQICPPVALQVENARRNQHVIHLPRYPGVLPIPAPR